jgi:uncharacterized membrane protein YuzA (DUF378 family)
VGDSWEVMDMKLLFGAILFIGSVFGVLVSFLSQIVVNSSVELINGHEMSMILGVFFIMTGLSGLYMILDHS